MCLLFFGKFGSNFFTVFNHLFFCFENNRQILFCRVLPFAKIINVGVVPCNEQYNSFNESYSAIKYKTIFLSCSMTMRAFRWLFWFDTRHIKKITLFKYFKRSSQGNGTLLYNRELCKCTWILAICDLKCDWSTREEHSEEISTLLM